MIATIVLPNDTPQKAAPTLHTCKADKPNNPATIPTIFLPAFLAFFESFLQTKTKISHEKRESNHKRNPQQRIPTSKYFARDNIKAKNKKQKKHYLNIVIF